MKIEVGTKLFCNWGAMHPTEEATITEVNLGNVVYVTEDGDIHRCSPRDIRTYGDGRPSPIGVFFLESAHG